MFNNLLTNYSVLFTLSLLHYTLGSFSQCERLHTAGAIIWTWSSDSH